MIQYGFERLVLLGSAGYQRAELPLDAAVSLIAPNNTGKTSLINALQFLLIIDQRRMDFGAHDLEKSKRFYFPNNSAYILLEACLPETGTVVLGCVGKGVSHDYQYFAYKGALDLDDYRLDGGALVAEPQLVNHLATRQRLVFVYKSPNDFRDALYGGRRKRAASEPDFTLFHLEHQSDAAAYRQVLTRTLRLDRLTSADVKNYLLEIFKRDLSDAAIDFRQEWEKAFSEVNSERAQYQAAVNQSARILSLAKQVQERLTLRGKLIVWCPQIEEDLKQWHSYYESTAEELAAKVLQCETAQKQSGSRIQELSVERLVKQQSHTQLLALNQQQAELERRFTLLSGREQLETQLAAVKENLEAQITLLGQVKSRSVEDIRRDLRRQQQLSMSLHRQQETLTDNLYRHMADHLSEEELLRLNRVLQAGVMQLGPADFELDMPRLKQQLSQTQAEAHKQRLEQEQQQLRQELADFDTWQHLLAQSDQRAEQLIAHEQELDRLQAELAAINQQQLSLVDQLNALRQAQMRLDDEHNGIVTMRNQREDQGPEFGYLESLSYHPWLGGATRTLDTLYTRLQEFQTDSRQLLALNSALQRGLQDLHAGGLTKYEHCPTQDEEWSRILDFHQMLPKEAEALEKKARSAVINVTASLKQLRQGLNAFKAQMRGFNRLVSQRQLSDLRVFKIEPRDEAHLVEAIEILLDKSAQVETGESFDLFNQQSVLDDVRLDRAKQTLFDEGNARQGLRVADLFRLEFVQCGLQRHRIDGQAGDRAGHAPPDASQEQAHPHHLLSG